MRRFRCLLFIAVLFCSCSESNLDKMPDENENSNSASENLKEVSINIGKARRDLSVEEGEMQGAGQIEANDLFAIQIRECDSNGANGETGKVVAAGLFKGPKDLKVNLDLTKDYYIEATLVKGGLNVDVNNGVYGAPFNCKITDIEYWDKETPEDRPNNGFADLSGQTKSLSDKCVPQERWYYREIVKVGTDPKLDIALRLVSFKIATDMNKMEDCKVKTMIMSSTGGGFHIFAGATSCDYSDFIKLKGTTKVAGTGTTDIPFCMKNIRETYTRVKNLKENEVYRFETKVKCFNSVDMGTSGGALELYSENVKAAVGKISMFKPSGEKMKSMPISFDFWCQSVWRGSNCYWDHLKLKNMRWWFEINESGSCNLHNHGYNTSQTKFAFDIRYDYSQGYAPEGNDDQGAIRSPSINDLCITESHIYDSYRMLPSNENPDNDSDIAVTIGSVINSGEKFDFTISSKVYPYMNFKVKFIDQGR